MTETEIRQTEEKRTPGARRKRPPLSQTLVMLDAGERDALDAIADERGESRSALIREAVRRVWLKGRKG